MDKKGLTDLQLT